MLAASRLLSGALAAAAAALAVWIGGREGLEATSIAALAAGAAGVAAFLGAAVGGRRRTVGGEAPAATETRAPPPRREADHLDSLPAPVLLADRDLRLLRVNRAALELFGPAVIGRPLVELIRDPDLMEAVEECALDRAPRTVDFVQRRAKEDRTIRAHVRALAGAGALVQFEDQTRARALEDMREAFVANASHELRTPLASILGFIETLQGPAKDDPKARERFLGIMAAQADRMRRLVEDLLSLSRIEMSAHMRPEGRVDLGALAQETAAALESVAADAGAKIVVEPAPGGPVVAGDRDQIAQLLTNLIDNAVKYGGEGVTVKIRPHPPALERPGMVGLTVADDGPGVAREHLPRLTERFYRVSAAKSRAVGGTGLGLAIAKHILQRHRGELSIASTLGEGSAFTIWLPAERDSS